jgi:hypothetical protein
MVKWLNHVTIAAPRNGTNTHVVDPAAGVVVAGAAFEPTAGRLLVCVAGGSVTSSTPDGWTLPAGGSAVNNSGLYLWYRIAAGDDVFSTTHNGSNFPAVFDIYEFPADTLFIAAAAQGNVPATGGVAGPALAGLTADADFRAAIACQGFSSGPDPSYVWSNGAEAVDTFAAWATEAGYGYSLSYLEDQVDAAYSSAATSTLTFGGVERIVFALDVASTSTEHPAEGSVSVTTGAAGTATALRQAEGSAPVATTAAGAATTQRAALGTIAVATGASGIASQQHPATGNIAITTTASGTAARLRSGGSTMLITDQCGWDTQPCECSALDTLHENNPNLAAAVEAMAARHLYRWTGSRFAPCPVTIRPCRSDCRSVGQVLNFNGQYGHPLMWPGFGCACGGQDSCSCNNICQIELTGPVLAVDEIWIDGVLLPPTAYRVDNGKYLVRIDGECWPECNDLSKPYMVVPDGPGEEAVLGTWAVTYRHGLPIPAGGAEVAGLLACEIAKAICNDKSCALPTRVREISREGITIAMLDDFTGLSEGMTGLWLVDSWIMTNRPGRPSHFSVWSPETRERGRS